MTPLAVKIFLGLMGISISLATPFQDGDYYKKRDVMLNDWSLTRYEYKQIKDEAIKKMSGKSFPTYNQTRLWVDVVRKELSKCDKPIKNITKDNLIEKINDYLKSCDD
jgi:hypothetical protein